MNSNRQYSETEKSKRSSLSIEQEYAFQKVKMIYKRHLFTKRVYVIPEKLWIKSLDRVTLPSFLHF